VRGVDNIVVELLGSGDDILIIRWASVRGQFHQSDTGKYMHLNEIFRPTEYHQIVSSSYLKGALSYCYGHSNLHYNRRFDWVD
jgi:hypothetical protein